MSQVGIHPTAKGVFVIVNASRRRTVRRAASAALVVGAVSFLSLLSVPAASAGIQGSGHAARPAGIQGTGHSSPAGIQGTGGSHSSPDGIQGTG